MVNIKCVKSIDFPEKEKVFAKATHYLKSMQRSDGGWGEDGKSYYKGFESYSKNSTPHKLHGHYLV